MSTDYEEWFKWQVKVIREEALELRQEKGYRLPIYSIKQDIGEQKGEQT